jgi:tetratricopeptide (TPR) repeat protein/2-polyprenyl-3-methyl-5-hydroxy-6-metoxy-1,4-benzoquinol methylase
MLRLPNVTLLTATAVSVEDTVQALSVCMRQIDFAAVRLLTPERPAVLPRGIEHVAIAPMDFNGYSRFILNELHKHFETAHCLVIQADGFVVNPEQWREEFLSYDYIGAPWPEQVQVNPGAWWLPLDRNRVGNGGFSVRSHRLMRLAGQIDFERLDYPLRSEDLVLCHYLYEHMRAQGVNYAPAELAARFSMETRLDQYPHSLDTVFGFHGKHLLREVLRRLPDSDFAALRARISNGSVGQTLPQRQQLSDLEGTRVKVRGAAVDSGPSVPSRDSAVALIDEGNALEEQGRIAEAMARYDAAIRADPRCARAHLNRGNAQLAGAQIDEARSAYQLAIACDPHYAAAHFNLGNLNCRVGEYERALQDYQAAIAIKPDFADAFVAMANALDTLGRTSEAIRSYERALAINPGYAEVHLNLGVLAMTAGRHEQAVDSLRRAIGIRPDYTGAHAALGKVLSNLGHLDAAEASLRHALSTAPDSGEILYELAMVLRARHKSPEAVQLTLSSLERAPTWTIKTAFANCVARTRFMTDEPRIRAALTTAITEPWTIPYQLCWPALSLIMLDPRIASCVRLANERWPARVPRAALFGADGLTALAADPLLHALLEAAPVSTIEFERFLTGARHALLETATSEQAPDPADIAALPFYAALARQCFINEYIFDCNDSERKAAAACRTKLLALVDANAVVAPLLLLAVAAYFPLYTLPEPSRLLATNQHSPVDEVLRQQVREPLNEQALRAGIECLTSITHGVSEKVREQYEQNPYPRWVKLPVQDPELRFNDELRRTLPLARFTPMHDDSQPEMLIAGCGTGSQPILATQRFRGIRVLAVDLSLNSISYAKRKTQELGIRNIEYAQADILQLGHITRTFDIIAVVGVLHHLADPFMGWRTLLSRLRPGGFMRLGLYSQLARRDVVKAREFIAARGYASTPGDIRRFRRDLAGRDESAELQSLSKISDFYSTSECRDLLFHVQEHRLTLDQIESFLSESGLHFIGFELDPGVLHQYRTRFTDDPAGINLSNWARFEADNPDTFVAMYQFWIQKPIRH